MWEKFEKQVPNTDTESLTSDNDTIETVLTQTNEEKNKLFESLMWASLKENTEHAKELTKITLEEMEWNDTLFNKLKKYQTLHLLLPADGRVWPETYAEMKSEAILKRANDKFETEWLSVDTIKDINDITQSLGKTSKNKSELNVLLARFKTEKQFKTKREKPEFKEVLDKSVIVANNEVTKLENSKEWKSFYATIKDDEIPWDEKIKIIASDPTTLMVWGLLFLFWVIWGDSKYTNSFMKRIGWIMWWALFGKSLWNKLWAGEMFKDMKEVWWEVADSVVETSVEVSAKTKKWVKEAWAWVSSFDHGEVTKKISENLKNLTNSFTTHNETLKPEEWEENDKWYIEPEKLKALSGLVDDTSFNQKKLEELNNIKTIWGLTEIWVADTITKKLTEKWIEENDLKNFIKIHLKYQFQQNKDGASTIKDLYITNKIKELIPEEALEKDWTYTEDNELNIDLENKLYELIGDTDENNKRIWIALSNAIKNNNLGDFNIDEFSWWSKVKAKVTEIINLVKKYKKQTNLTNDKIKKIEALKTPIPTRLKKEQIEGFLTKLGEIKLVNVSSAYLDTKFKTAKDKKMAEILGWANDKNITILKIGAVEIKVKDKLEELKKSSEEAKHLEKLGEIKFENIPTESNTPIEFKKWYEKNKDNIGIVKKYIEEENNNNTAKVKELAKEKAKEITKFKESYEKVKVKYIEKIVEINKLDSESQKKDIENFTAMKKITKQQSEKLNLLTSEVYTWIELSDLTDFFKKLSWEYIPKKYKNSFIELDKALDSKTERPEINETANQIKTLNNQIENAYPTDIFNNDQVKIENETITETAELIIEGESITEIIEAFIEKENIINSFDNDSIKKIKEKELKEEFQKLTTAYLNKINSSNNIIDLEKIKSNYKSNVTDKLWILSNLLNILEESPVEDAYEKKIEKFKEVENNKKIEEFGKKSIKEVLTEKWEIYDRYMEFLDLYKTIPEIKTQAILFINNTSNIKVSTFISTLENNIKLKENQLTLNDGNKHLWVNWVSPVRESFTKNSKDLLADIKGQILK